MARQPIDIGIQGNDGTGDSIRESFRKVNENFTQLYAIFGEGDRIGFLDLDDAPPSYAADQVIVADADGVALLAKNLVGGEGIAVDHTDENEIRIISTGGKVSNDAKPSLGNHLNAELFSIGNIAEPSDEVAVRFNDVHDTAITADDLVISRGYADQRYLQASIGGAAGSQIRVRSEPVDTTEYTRVIDAWSSGYARIPNHGFNTGANGIAFKYDATLFPATGLTRGNTYYLRYFDKDRMGVHETPQDAIAGVNRIIANQDPEILDRGTETFVDAYYDENLPGNWLSNEALPRESVVRREGDFMTGPLLLSDHPGSLAGAGSPNGVDDLQAATKFYVDSSSFASAVNLFVATNGDDTQVNTPPGKEGRAFAYAYETVGAACERAEEIIAESVSEPGPYRQIMTYAGYNNPAYLNTIVTNIGAQRTLNVFTNGGGVDQSKDVDNRDLREGSIIKGIRSGATGRVSAYNGIVSLDDVYVVELLHTVSDLNNFQTDYVNASVKVNANKAFIAAEVVEYLSDKYPSLPINTAQFENEVELIVDALVSDIKFGGNKKSIRVGRAYYIGISSTLPIDQLNQTVDGFNYINLLIQQIITNTVIPPAPDSVSFGKRSALPQITTGPAGEAASAVVLARLVASINNIVVHGTAGDGTLVEFIQGELLEFGQPVPEAQITVRVESGVYYEQLPIRVATNVSIKGDEFRRSIIRPADGISSSKWARIYFYRDDSLDGLTRTYTSNVAAASSSAKIVTLATGEIDGLEVGMYLKVTAGTGSVTQTTQVARLLTSTTFEISETPTVTLSGATIRGLNSTGLAPTGHNFGYHYLIDPTDGNSNPKANKDMDMFLLNDGTILRNITGQSHGGFMCVLDPEGQIQTKSPYFQTATSLSGSINKHAFRGGMFVDGFGGNLPAVISDKNSDFSLDLSGLTVRAPGIPTSFYIVGVRYQINEVLNYNKIAGTATVTLDESTPFVPSVSTPIAITIETPGNRSMLCNDFTQVNDLGYGIVATNNGLVEAVSMFTYYNYTSYLANNGAQIRSITGSSCYGIFGLKAAGRDPNEVPDPVALADNTLQTAKIYKRGSFASKNNAGDQSLYIDHYEFAPFNITELEIDHSNTRSSIVENTTSRPANITIVNGGTGYAVDDFLEVDGGTLVPSGSKTRFRVVEVDNGGVGPGAITGFELIEAGEYFLNPVGGYPTVTGIVATTVEAPGTGINATFTGTYLGDITTYEVATTEITTSIGVGIDLGGVVGTRTVLKLNLSSAGNTTGLQASLSNDQIIILRSLQNLRFSGIEEIKPVRPSTALEFTSPTELGAIYRTLAYNLTNAIGTVLPPGQAVLTFDSSFDYSIIQVNAAKISDVDYVDGGVKTMGATVGDTRIAVVTVSSPASVARLNSGILLTLWQGRMHVVDSYTAPAGANAAYITISDLAYGSGTILPAGTGIAEPFTQTRNTNLRAGLPSGAPAEITVNISTCRATGHDFLDVGSGGFNSSNYPNNLYGAPVDPPTDTNIVVEQGQGRVFHASTDQNGIFRVGRFFTVDQGNGTVTFAASIALSNLDGIGFKRGTVVKEFSTDDSMTDNAEDTVPVESAVRGYIDRRLGRTHNGGLVALADRIPALTGGFLPVDNNPTLEDDLSMGSTVGHRITNLVTNSSSSTDAANVGYVDGKVAEFDSWYKLKEVLLMTPTASDIPVFVGAGRTVVSTSLSGDVLGTFTSTNTTTLATAITGTGQLNVSSGVVVTNITGFPSSGHFQIGAEIFSYTSVTLVANRFDDVTRAAVDTTASTHSIGATVIGLDNSRLDLQIQPGVIVNNDVNVAAAIDQSKLNMNIAATAASAPTGTAAQIQAASGLTSFDSANFVVTNGWVGIKAGGVALGEIQNIAAGSILGNLTGSAAAPQEVTTTGIITDGINSLFTAVDAGASVMTRRVNSMRTVTTFTNVIGTPIGGSGTLANIPITSTSGTGSGAVASVGYSGGSYNAVVITYGGNGYAEGDQLIISGALLGGTSPINDLTFSIAVTGTNIDTTVYFGLTTVSTIGEAGSLVRADSAKNLGNVTNKFNTVHATTFVGSLNGNAATVTNGVYTTDVGTVTNTMLTNSSVTVNGTSIALGASGTVTAAAGTLTGTTLATGVVDSSITNFGDLVRYSVTNNITSAGTTNADATGLTRMINIVTSTPAGSGIRLPAAVAGYRVLIRNAGTVNISLYPTLGASINDGVEGEAVLSEVGGSIEYFCAASESAGTGGRWYTINATFA